MLANYLSHITPYIFKGYVIFACLLTLCMVHAYDVDVRRAKDDPEKRNYHLSSAIIIPWLWPFLPFALITVRMSEALVHLIFLALALILILFFRKPRLLPWLDKVATKIGNLLLEINNYLLKLMFGNFANSPQSP